MILVAVENRANEVLPVEEYRACALFVLEQQAVLESTELAVSLVGLDEIHELNLQFRGLDEPTDVLSFPCDDAKGECGPAEETLLLGDVIIAPEMARKHADIFDSTFEEEMFLILIHGILHLLGYDHADDDGYATMCAMENELLGLWGEQ